MSHHAAASPQIGDAAGTWLPLTEYAVRSGVSLSTIRRKIKSNTIPYRLEKGRYLILYAESGAPIKEEIPERMDPSPRLAAVPPPPALSSNVGTDQAVRMISEAFEHTLREKDERIRLLEKRNEDLEERLNELRTLVRVLEEKYEVRY